MAAPGSLVQQRYRLDRAIGKEGTGLLWEATDERNGQKVALRLWEENPAVNTGRLDRELQIRSLVSHDALVDVSDWGVDGGARFVVMPWVPTDDLATQLMERGTPLDPDQTIALGRRLADGLHALHTQLPPLLHRDVKPSNIRTAADGDPLLVDVEGPRLGGQTFADDPYKAPEFDASAPLTPRVDLYALAATLLFAVTGAPPPPARERARILESGGSDPLLERLSALPAGLRGPLSRALTLAPGGRFASVLDFRSALGDGVAAEPPGVVTAATPPAVDLPPADLPPADLPPADLPPADLPPADLPPVDLPPRPDVLPEPDPFGTVERPVLPPASFGMESAPPPPTPGEGPPLDPPAAAPEERPLWRRPACLTAIVASLLAALCVICAASAVLISARSSTTNPELPPIGQSEAPATRTPSVEPSDSDSPPVVGSEGLIDTVSVFELQVGYCFNDDDPGMDSDGLVETIDIYSCDVAHDNEIYALADYPAGPDDPYPGEEAVDEFSEQFCLGAFEGYVGLEYSESILAWFPLQPTENSWNERGDREILCALYEGSLAKLVGSMQGAQR